VNYCCDSFQGAINKGLIQKPGKRLPSGDEFGKQHFIEKIADYNHMVNRDYMYITNCPFCGEEIGENNE
jgi:hypothetical protein